MLRPTALRFRILDTAKRLLREILDHLQPELESGTPIVVLEPSCAAVFRDELVNLFPEDANAKRLCQQTFLLSEFLDKTKITSVSQIVGKAIVQGHCHQKSLMAMESEARLLSKIGLEAEILTRVVAEWPDLSDLKQVRAN